MNPADFILRKKETRVVFNVNAEVKSIFELKAFGITNAKNVEAKFL